MSFNIGDPVHAKHKTANGVDIWIDGTIIAIDTESELITVLYYAGIRLIRQKDIKFSEVSTDTSGYGIDTRNIFNPDYKVLDVDIENLPAEIFQDAEHLPQKVFDSKMKFYSENPKAYLFQLIAVSRKLMEIQKDEIQRDGKPSETTQKRLMLIDDLLNAAKDAD